MHTLINYLRWQCESVVRRSNHDRISQVVTVWNNAAARPTANQCSIACKLAGLGKSYEVTEGNRRGVPAVKSQNRGLRSAQKDFINRHVERSGTRRRIVNDNQFGKHSFRFP